MNSASQSRHFNLHWLDRPQAWLKGLDHLVPDDPKAAWPWHVTHHQLLTLARRSEREAGLSTLWFSVTTPTDDPAGILKPILLGAVLPEERVAVCTNSKIPSAQSLDDLDPSEITRFLKTRLKIKSMMGSETDLSKLGLLDPDHILERQVAWGKRLSEFNADVIQHTQRGLRSRRAGEVDRPLLNRWAKVFAGETGANPAATVLEAAEWMRRGRLYIFETTAPVGMVALSGEYEDRQFGRSCRLSLIFTDPAYRRRGIGHDMLKIIEHDMRLEHAQALIVYSDPKNPRIRDFYSDLGFKPSDDWIEASLPATGFNVNTTG